MSLQYSPITFFNIYLKGNEMTDFVDEFININNLSIKHLKEGDKVYYWYKVRDLGNLHLFINLIGRSDTLPYIYYKCCLFIGFTWYRGSYEYKPPFLNFLELFPKNKYNY